MSRTEDEVKVGIPRAIHEQIELKIRGTRFESVQAYVKGTLENVMREGAKGPTDAGSPQRMNPR